MDALNQLPNYFIRGEQHAAFFSLYETHKRLLASYEAAKRYKAEIKRLKLAQKGQAAVKQALPSAVNASAAAVAAGTAGGNATLAGTGGLKRHRLPYPLVKAMYNKWAPRDKQAWFNDLSPLRLKEALRSMYVMLYGYHPGIVSGFKEIRYTSLLHGLNDMFRRSPDGPYVEFEGFLRFLRLLCVDVRLVFNSRASAGPEANQKLAAMMLQSLAKAAATAAAGQAQALGGQQQQARRRQAEVGGEGGDADGQAAQERAKDVYGVTGAQEVAAAPRLRWNQTDAGMVRITEALRETHGWFDRYVAEHRDHAFRVHMEDMFDAQRNATLARALLAFLGEDPQQFARIHFDRMPSWDVTRPSGRASKAP